MSDTPTTGFPELTRDENICIRDARKRGYAAFFPCYPNAEAQARNTLKGAKVFLEKLRETEDALEAYENL